jgi:hypothetical protein
MVFEENKEDSNNDKDGEKQQVPPSQADGLPLIVLKTEWRYC